MQVAEPILDSHRMPCQVVQCVRDSLLARPRGHCRAQCFVHLRLPLQPRHRCGEFTVRQLQIGDEFFQLRRIIGIAVMRCGMCQGGAGLPGQNGQ